MASALPVITSGLGLFNGIQQQNSARGDANRAMDQQDRLLARREEIQNMIKAFLDDQRKRGVFDPKVRMDMIRQTIAGQNAEDLTNAAGAARVAGYAAGDTPLVDSIGKASLSNQRRLGEMAYGAYGDALNDERSAYGLLADSASLDSPGYGIANSRLSDARERSASGAQGIGSLIGTLGDIDWGAFGRTIRPRRRGFNLGNGSSGSNQSQVGY